MKLTVRRRSYVRKDGTRVRAATYQVRDRGALGRTPPRKRWYAPATATGWRKTLPARQRRSLVLRAHKGDLLAAGRAMQALANVTTDRRTKLLAGWDARYFFRRRAK